MLIQDLVFRVNVTFSLWLQVVRNCDARHLVLLVLCTILFVCLVCLFTVGPAWTPHLKGFRTFRNTPFSTHRIHRCQVTPLQLVRRHTSASSEWHSHNVRSQGWNPFALWGKMTPTANLEPAILAVGCELELAPKSCFCS